jgi:MFS family permease
MNASTLTYMLGLAVSMLMGGFADDFAHTRHLLRIPAQASFYLVSLLFLITAVAAFFLAPHRTREELEAHHEDQGTLTLSDVYHGIKAVPDLMVIAFVAFFGVGLLMPITKYFAMDEFHLTETGYGWLVLPVALAIAIASLFAGGLSDKWGRARSVRLGIGVAAVGMWAVTVSHVSWELMAAAIFLGVGFVIGMPAWLAFVADISAPRIRGTIIGTLGGALGIGAVVGASLGAYLYKRVDLTILGHHVNSHYSPFVVSALALTATFIMVLVLISDRDCRRIGECPPARKSPK